MRSRLLILLACLLPCTSRADEPAAEPQPWAGCIQTIECQSDHPYFLPTNPRVTLTVRFPAPILDADGAGFTTNEAVVPGEYRVSWREGDNYLSITPLEGAQMRNLNVQVANTTIVLVPYPVENVLQAVTSLTLVPPRPVERIEPSKPRTVFRAPEAQPAEQPQPTPPHADKPTVEQPMKRLTELPESPFEKITPARLIGMLDRLKLLHATRPSEMDGVLSAMPQISVADSGAIFREGLLRLQVVRQVRDNRLDLLGFIVVVKNLSKREVGIDPESWAARVGNSFIRQTTSDCRATIPPGDSTVAYFVIAGDGNGGPGYLSVENKCRVSVAIVSPRVNPGAEIAESITGGAH